MGGRVGGQLAVTRSIGDHSLRKAGVIPSPTVHRQPVRSTDRWLIVATDGVWDSLSEKVPLALSTDVGRGRAYQGKGGAGEQAGAEDSKASVREGLEGQHDVPCNKTVMTERRDNH